MANDAAFEILYREYYPRVFGLCRRLLGVSELAEDATQEVFMRAYRNFRRYDAGKPFWPWIAAIANNHCVDVLRQQSKTPLNFGDEVDELAAAERSDVQDVQMLGALISAQEAQSLTVAIDTLDAKYRVPIVLAYFNQLSYDEIAGQLEISRNHVGVLLLRGKQKLREILQGGVAS